MPSAVIVDVVRTATGRGKPGGALSGVHPTTLLASTIRALIDRNGIDPAQVDDVIAGFPQDVVVTRGADQDVVAGGSFDRVGHRQLLWVAWQRP